MAANIKKRIIPVFKCTVPFMFATGKRRGAATATEWISEESLQENGLVLRLLFSNANSRRCVVLQMCTTDQVEAYNAMEGDFKCFMTDLPITTEAQVEVAAGIEFYYVRLTCDECPNDSDWQTSITKPTPSKLLIDLGLKSPLKKCGHTCPVVWEVKFRSSSTVGQVLGASALLGKLHGGLLSDVTLRVGQKELRAHRCVLAAVSEVFRTMFEGDRFQESCSGVVDIQDVRVEVLEAALRHVYGLELGEVDANTMVDLLVLSERYQMLELKSICEDLLSRDTSLDALELLAVADTHRAHRLKEAVIERIVSCRVRQKILSATSAEKIVKTNPRAFVELFMKM